MTIEERARCSEKLKYKKKYVDANPPYHKSGQEKTSGDALILCKNQVPQKPIKGF